MTTTLQNPFGGSRPVIFKSSLPETSVPVGDGTAQVKLYTIDPATAESLNIPSGNYFFKQTDELEGQEAQESYITEAAYAILYKMLIEKYNEKYGIENQAVIPEYRLIINDQNQVVGVLSNALSEFRSLANGDSDETFFNIYSLDDLKNLLNKSNFALLLVVSFFLEEDDLHGRNIGQLDGNTLGRIDFDGSGISLDIEKNRNDLDEFKNLYLIDSENVKNFPLLNDVPNGGFRKNWIQDSFPGFVRYYEELELSTVAGDALCLATFKKKVNDAFAMIALLTKQDFRGALRAHTSPDEGLGQKIVDHIMSRKKLLRSVVNPEALNYGPTLFRPVTEYPSTPHLGPAQSPTELPPLLDLNEPSRALSPDSVIELPLPPSEGDEEENPPLSALFALTLN